VHYRSIKEKRDFSESFSITKGGVGASWFQ